MVEFGLKQESVDHILIAYDHFGGGNLQVLASSILHFFTKNSDWQDIQNVMQANIASRAPAHLDALCKYLDQFMKKLHQLPQQHEHPEGVSEEKITTLITQLERDVTPMLEYFKSRTAKVKNLTKIADTMSGYQDLIKVANLIRSDLQTTENELKTLLGIPSSDALREKLKRNPASS